MRRRIHPLAKLRQTFRPSLELLENRLTPVVISNGIGSGTVGQFQADLLTGGEIDQNISTQTQATLGGAVTNPLVTDPIFQYLTYINVGNGTAFDLGSTNITQPALLRNGQVFSSGTFTGSAGNTIDWTATSTLSPSSQQLSTTLTFAAETGTLGTLEVIQYLDEDTTSNHFTDILAPSSPGSSDFQLPTINQSERVGVGQGGPTSSGASLQNMTFDGFAADQWQTLQNTITSGGSSFSTSGNINTAALPPSFDPVLNQTVYGPADVTTALSWTADPNATSALVTPSLTILPGSVNLPAITTDLPNLSVGQAFSTKLTAQGGNPPYTFALAGGQLPPGLSVNTAAGTLAGTPTTAGTYSFTLSVTDSTQQVGTRNYTVTVFPAASSLRFVQQPTNTQAGSIISPAVTVQLLNASSQPLAVPGIPVTMSLYSSTGTLLGTTTVQTDSTGLATFSDLQINIAGVKRIQAADGNLTTLSDPFTISPAAASQLVFTQQPTDTQQGATMAPAVTVQLEDQFGNLVSQAGTIVSLTLASGTGNILGATSVQTNASGLATFSTLRFDTVGAKTLQADSGTLTGTSNSFNITAAPSHLVFLQQPTSTSLGSVISPAVTVQLEDPFGNPVTQAGISVTLKLASGTGVLQGTLTQTTDASGLATFSNLKVSTPGTKQLQATANGLVAGLSSTFLIAGPAVGFTFSSLPPILQINHAYQITVQAVDALGHPALLPLNTPTLSFQSKTSFTLKLVKRVNANTWIYNLTPKTLGANQQITFKASLSYSKDMGGNVTISNILKFGVSFGNRY